MISKYVNQTKSSMMVLGLTLITALTGCAEKNFEAVPSTDGPKVVGTPRPTPPPGCTTDNVDKIYRPTKILFVVDTSGSNVNVTANYGSTPNCGNGGLCTPPTDPNKDFRGGAISDFLARFRHKTNFSWGFNTFSANRSIAYINSGSEDSPIFSDNPNSMNTALNRFNNSTDSGNTPYRQAVNLAAKAIEDDPDKNDTEKPNYFVILLTDGYPTDYVNQDGSLQEDAVKADLNALLAKAPGQVNLSTIYYGQGNDPRAIALLKEMSEIGAGQFANVNDPNSDFKIDDVIPGSNNGCK